MKLYTKAPTELTVYDRPSGLASLRGNIEAMTTFRRADQEAAHEQCRAVLAYTAMENAAMLSAMEAFCYRTAPFGEERYKRIADAYTTGAVARILRW